MNFLRFAMKTKTKKFITGGVYSARSICDSNCIFEITIIKRTLKTVTYDYMGDPKTSRIKTDENGNEYFFVGSYSMAPMFKA